MKRAILLLFVLTLSITVFACSKDEDGDTATKSAADFRNARWGMTPEEVKASEKLMPTTDRPELVTYRGDYDGMVALIGYEFENNELVRAGYLITVNYNDPNYYIKDFDSLKQKLIEKYGGPTSDEITWKKGETAEEDPDKFGKAVCAGKLRYYTLWQTERNFIKLRLDGQDGKCQLGIQFESIDLFVIPAIDSGMRGSPEPTPEP